MPIRITFIITGLNTGGAEKMLLKLCSRFDKNRFNLSVISLSDKGNVGSDIEALGIRVYSLGMHSGKPKMASYFRLRKFISMLRPHLIQGWMYHGNLAASLVGNKDNPVIWGVRQSLYKLKNERLFTRLVILFGAIISRYSPKTIVYNSSASAHQHEVLGFDPFKSVIIPNGFETDLFVPNKNSRNKIFKELGIPDNFFLIGLIARYHIMKDHHNFFVAASLLVKEFSDVRFLLVGNRVDSQNLVLVELIAKYNLDKHVILLGERNDIAQLNAALDIATSSSAWGEGFANSIGEAMSCGVPCVVTDIGDSASIVGDTGLVVPSKNPIALADAWNKIILLTQNEREILGSMARKRIIDNYSLDSVVNKYENLYSKLNVMARN